MTVDLRTLRSIKIKYFSPEGATKANDFLCSSILAVLLTHNFYIKMILLTNNFYDKKSSTFPAYIMYYNLFLRRIARLPIFAKIRRVVFLDSGVQYEFLCT